LMPITLPAASARAPPEVTRADGGVGLDKIDVGRG